MRMGFAGLFVIAFTWLTADGAEPRRVLLLHSFGQEFEPITVFSQTFRQELARQSHEPLDFFDVAVGSARFDRPDEAPLVDYCLALFAGRRVDLVVAVAGSAGSFAQKYRARLFPDTPMMLASVDQRMFQVSMLTTNDAVLSFRHDPQFMVEAILRLLPVTTNIVVVFGSSPVERFWSGEFKRSIQSITPPVGSESFSELSFPQMKERAATLPPHSVLLYGALLLDAEGVPQTEDTLRNLHAVANAPMFGIHDFQLGRGIVGGPLMPIRELSRRSASAAARILQGEAPANFRPPPLSYGPPTYDWRELRRWGIAERSLPPGSIVQFREKTIWQRYRRWIISGISVLVAEGAIIALLVANLRRRRRAEAALERSEQDARSQLGQLSAIYHAAPTGLAFVDTGLRYVSINEHLAEINRLPAAAHIGRTLREVLGDLADQIEPLYLRIIEQGQPITDVEFRRGGDAGPEAERVWLASYHPVKNEQGAVLGVSAVVQEITARRRVEETNLKLAHASRLATVGELTAMIVHELSQPLSAMLCNARAAEMMLENSNPPLLEDLHEIMGDIQRDNRRASESVQRMRTLLRQRRLELRPLDLRELVDEVLQIASREAARRHVQIKTKRAGEFPPVKGDRVLLQQVLLNLILNGMDAMANTPESKRCLLIRMDENDHDIEVAVTDAGQGIPLERLPHIFDSFFTTKEEGLGLGLSISKWIIEAHRGGILAQNDANGGATFRFTLPTNNAVPTTTAMSHAV
jgi:signal transduction histidine kinase